MICQSCGKNTATTRVKTIVNGELTEYALCSACAQKLGYTSWLYDWGSGLESFLGGFFGEQPRQEQQTLRCKGCGASFEEISQSGEMGCPLCYTTFRDRLMPTIRRIHGTAKHRGKTPGGHTAMLRVAEPAAMVNPVQESQSPLQQKQAQLQKAIEEQNFELAATLRDEIKRMQNEKNENNGEGEASSQA